MRDAVVRTRQGDVRGTVGDGVVTFKGVPFAAAPEGALRFRAPAPPAAWDGVRDASAFGAAPPQPPPAPGVPPAWRPGDGLDCLTLNVWTPAPGSARLPVMVWLYGGRWEIGAAGLPQYDGARLARSGVVVVTVNYRVGFEGFGHVPGAPDNRGLLDQLAALRWVRENAAAFGGDPDNVTVFGQSAGAASAAFLASAGTGLFRRVIAQSIPNGLVTPGEARRTTERVADAAGVSVADLASLPPEEIVRVQPPGAFGPVADGELVTGPPWARIRPDVDLVCGFTHEEYRSFAPVVDPAGVDPVQVAAAVGLPAGAVDAYRAALPGADGAALFTAIMSDAVVRMPTTWAAENHARAGGRTWLYDFTWRGAAFGACHGVDVPFTFGDATSRFARRFLGDPPAGFEALSGALRASWTAFAATGDPGWPRFTPPAGRTRLWDASPADVPYPLAGIRAVWRDPAA
ncbi:carboxylesterase/lipase family protein [Actinomadura kijaniata]|uniref:carboxylesterase/lipase family protein n=1 Tax=Actinomadura kijaniata TaxID=46161 RepID=UPI00082C938C|nr:carboxylesterase family protein [Actinomadura kijaniata]